MVLFLSFHTLVICLALFFVSFQSVDLFQHFRELADFGWVFFAIGFKAAADVYRPGMQLCNGSSKVFGGEAACQEKGTLYRGNQIPVKGFSGSAGLPDPEGYSRQDFEGHALRPLEF